MLCSEHQHTPFKIVLYEIPKNYKLLNYNKSSEEHLP